MCTGINVTINKNQVYYVGDYGYPFNKHISENSEIIWEFKIKNNGNSDIYKLYQNNETDVCMQNCDPMAGLF